MNATFVVVSFVEDYSVNFISTKFYCAFYSILFYFKIVYSFSQENSQEYQGILDDKSFQLFLL